MINIRKRGNVYQYCFEAGKVNGKRKQITELAFILCINFVFLLRIMGFL